MRYVKHLFVALLFSFLWAGCANSQSSPSKSIQWLPVSPAQEPGGSVEGSQFVSKAGGFVIDIPAIPDQTLDFGNETAKNKGIDVGKQLAWRFENTVYTVMYSPPLDPSGIYLAQPLEEMVSGSRKGILRSGGKITSEKSIYLGKHSGIEFKYVSADGTKFIGRIYLVGETGYQVVGGYSSDDHLKEVLRVMDSFKLLISQP
jgi:hypothetical protein